MSHARELSHALCESDAPEWGEEDCAMRRRWHTAEPVNRALAEGDRPLGQGQTLAGVCRYFEITESTWHLWLFRAGMTPVLMNRADASARWPGLSPPGQRMPRKCRSVGVCEQEAPARR